MTRRTREQYNWLACEFDDMRIPASWHRFTSPRREKIEFVVVHHMVIKDTDPNDDEALQKCLDIWRTREASAHYGVDNDFVAQFVSDFDAAYATANTHGNHAGISIEHVNKTLNETGTSNDYIVSELTWKTGAKLAAYLHRLYKLGRPKKDVTLRKHSSFFATSCPGPYMDRIWDQYVAEAQRVYDSIGAVTPVPPVVIPPVVVPPKPVVTTVSGIHWNIAGSDTVNGYKAENGWRGPYVAKWMQNLGYTMILTCEAGQANLKRGLESVLGKGYSAHAKYIWASAGLKLLAPRMKSYSDTAFAYLSTLKWGAAVFFEKDGKKGAALEIHTDYRKPAKQAKQVQSIFKKFLADTDKMGIPRENLIVCGDFNWDGTAGDDPFKALKDWAFEEKGSRTVATFRDGRHLDGVLAHVNADVEVSRKGRNDGTRNLSDHFPLKWILNLK